MVARHEPEVGAANVSVFSVWLKLESMVGITKQATAMLRIKICFQMGRIADMQKLSLTEAKRFSHVTQQHFFLEANTAFHETKSTLYL